MTVDLARLPYKVRSVVCEILDGRASTEDLWARGHFEGRTTDDAIEMVTGWIHTSGRWALALEIPASFGEPIPAAYRYSLVITPGGLSAAIVRCHADAARVVEAYEAVGLHEAVLDCIDRQIALEEAYPAAYHEYLRIAAEYSAPRKATAWDAINRRLAWAMNGEDFNERAGADRAGHGRQRYAS